MVRYRFTKIQRGSVVFNFAKYGYIQIKYT